MTALRAPVVLILCAVAAGCGGADGSSGDDPLTAAADTVDGVERLRYAGGAAPALGWSLDTLLVLGDAFAENEYQFNGSSAEGLAADAAGNLVVLDRQGGRVLRYSPDGAHVATYGRKGEGPGELAQPLGAAVGPGDTIWVTDFSNRRLTGYPHGGGEPRAVPFPEEGNLPDPRMAVVEAGHLLRFRPLFNFRRGPGGGMEAERSDGSEDRPRLSLVRYDGDLNPLDTLWSSPEPPTDVVQIDAGGIVMVTMMAREFHPKFLWAAFPDGGAVVSDTADYVLRVVDPDGTVRRIIERGPTARAATEADREAVRRRLREQSESGASFRIGGRGPDEATRDRMLEQRLEQMTFAERIPRVVALAVDPEDRIWVGVSEETADVVERIDVYERSGRLLGELRDFPFPDVFLDRDRMGILRKDDLDVQQVVVLGFASRRAR